MNPRPGPTLVPIHRSKAGWAIIAGVLSGLDNQNEYVQLEIDSLCDEIEKDVLGQRPEPQGGKLS